MGRRLTLLTSALLAIGLYGCGEPPPPVEQKPRVVRTRVARPMAKAVPAVLAGVAKAGIESNLSFRVGGTIDALPARVGRVVRPGDVLGRLDPVDLELGVEEAKASLALAEAGLRQAFADYGRVRALYENNNAAKSDFDAGRASYESAGAQVDAAEKRLEQTQQQLGYTVLQAPIDGIIAAVKAEINETISGGQTVVRITSRGTAEIEVGVSEITIPLIVQAMPVTVTFDAIQQTRFTGIVTEVGVATAKGSSTYPVTVKLDDHDSRIRSGMAADVTFMLDVADYSERMVIPPVAVGEDDSGRFVFVVEDGADGTGRVSRRSVSVGRLIPLGLEITDGLGEGDIVVTAGVRRLTEGMAVRYTPEDQL